MDVIGQAIWFGIQVTWWLLQQAYVLSWKITKMLYETMLGGLFGGALIRNVPVILLVSAGIWTPVLMLVFVLFSGPEGFLSGLIIGPIWGAFAGMRAVREWEWEAMMSPPPAMPATVELLDTPLEVVTPSMANHSKQAATVEHDLTFFEEVEE